MKTLKIITLIMAATLLGGAGGALADTETKTLDTSVVNY